MRLFFALWPDEPTRSGLHDLSARMRKACGGRRIGRDNIHATLAFLGERPEAELPSLLGAAAGVRASAFDLSLDETGYWKHNRIAWAGASAPPAQLAELAASLRQGLSGAGIASDPKPFVLHVTLLRDASPPREALSADPIRWPVAEFALVQSVGGRYSILARWPLRG